MQTRANPLSLLITCLVGLSAMAMCPSIGRSAYLIYPENGATSVDLSPEFIWSGISGDLCVCKNPNMYTNCWSMSGSVYSPANFLYDLTPDTQYYWQIKTPACRKFSFFPASEIATFHTKSNTETTSTIVLEGWQLLRATTKITASEFTPQTNILSVWTWKNSAWSVLFPNDNDGVKAYTDSKGFSILNTISPGEGYWVNISGL